MKIGIADAEALFARKHPFPNLASMKISGYMKRMGHDVSLVIDPEGDLSRYDKVFLSKVFTGTEVPERMLESPNVIKGGTGFFYDKAPALPSEIEHCMPDYHLYDEWVEWEVALGKKREAFKCYRDYSIGFTTRGCFRKCPFCVNKNYDSVIKHSHLEEFVDWDRKKICLLDDNFFGCPAWKEILEELQETGKPFQFKQGLDERLLTKEKCEMLFRSRYDGDFIFAFDDVNDSELIEEKLKLIRSVTGKNCMFYVLVGYDRKQRWDRAFWYKDIHDMFIRIEILFRYGCLPYIMRYESVYSVPLSPVYALVAAWTNQPSFGKKLSLREFVEKSAGRRKDKENNTYMRVFNYLMANYDDAKKWADLRFERSCTDD